MDELRNKLGEILGRYETSRMSPTGAAVDIEVNALDELEQLIEAHSKAARIDEVKNIDLRAPTGGRIALSIGNYIEWRVAELERTLTPPKATKPTGGAMGANPLMMQGGAEGKATKELDTRKIYGNPNVRNVRGGGGGGIMDANPLVTQPSGAGSSAKSEKEMWELMHKRLLKLNGVEGYGNGGIL